MNKPARACDRTNIILFTTEEALTSGSDRKGDRAWPGAAPDKPLTVQRARKETDPALPGSGVARILAANQGFIACEKRRFARPFSRVREKQSKPLLGVD